MTEDAVPTGPRLRGQPHRSGRPGPEVGAEVGHWRYAAAAYPLRGPDLRWFLHAIAISGPANETIVELTDYAGACLILHANDNQVHRVPRDECALTPPEHAIGAPLEVFPVDPAAVAEIVCITWVAGELIVHAVEGACL